MSKLVRFLPLLLVVLFMAWCSTSQQQKRELAPQKVELTELFLRQGLIASGSPREGELTETARRVGRTGMNQLLYSAAPDASIDALRWIIEHGADPASIGAPEGVPLLHKAAQKPAYARLEFFLGLKLDPRQRGPGGNTLLHVAAAGGLDERVLQLLLSKGLALNDANGAGQLPVHVAGVKSLDVLVRAGADVDAVDGLGRTALHQAAADRRTEVVVELLRLGASVFKTDAKGRTPLHLAAQARAEAACDALLAAGAPRSARDVDGQTARDLAMAPGAGSNRYRGFIDKL
ncbi:MAG: ankyrin repeat domain-containing protein [Proteobacteria bacterium]|nr:ankyrin repeat domain-containing protein [Pseudomonadota bacterium]